MSSDGATVVAPATAVGTDEEVGAPAAPDVLADGPGAGGAPPAAAPPSTLDPGVAPGTAGGAAVGPVDGTAVVGGRVTAGASQVGVGAAMRGGVFDDGDSDHTQPSTAQRAGSR